MSLSIISAKYVSPLSVDVSFSDGTERIVDVGSFIRNHPHPQYNRYLDENKFRKFSIEYGNLVWGKDWDLIFPVEDLYKGHLSQ